MGRFEPGNTIGRRWQPGQSGNPTGRPRIKLLREAARRLLNSADEHGRDKAELVAEHIYERAMSRDRGSLEWMRLLIEIVDGKAGHHDDEQCRDQAAEQTAEPPMT